MRCFKIYSHAFLANFVKSRNVISMAIKLISRKICENTRLNNFFWSCFHRKFREIEECYLLNRYHVGFTQNFWKYYVKQLFLKLFSQKVSWNRHNVIIAIKLISRKIRQNMLNNFFGSCFHRKFREIV